MFKIVKYRRNIDGYILVSRLVVAVIPALIGGLAFEGPRHPSHHPHHGVKDDARHWLLVLDYRTEPYDKQHHHQQQQTTVVLSKTFSACVCVLYRYPYPLLVCVCVIVECTGVRKRDVERNAGLYTAARYWRDEDQAGNTTINQSVRSKRFFLGK